MNPADRKPAERTLAEMLDDMRRYDYAEEQVVYGKVEAIVRRAVEVVRHLEMDLSPAEAILSDAGLTEER